MLGTAMALLLVALTVRLHALERVPPGLTHDEAGHAHDAEAILNGARPLYQTVGYGREPLYDYLVAGAMALLGPTPWTMRLCSVACGLFTLLLTFAWARRAFDAPVALAALAFQAASFWSLATSRQALRSTLLPALFTAAVYVFWRILYGRPGWRRWLLAALFALFIGGTLYTYLPARAVWLLFPAFLGYLLLVDRAALRRAWRPLLAGLAAGLLLAAPLFAYLRAHSDAEQRLGMLDEPLQALAAGDASAVGRTVWEGLGALFLPGRGDDFLAYAIPGRPFLDPLTGALFLAGIVLCLVRWRRPGYAFASMWLLIGIAPSLLTGARAMTTRSIVALPAVYVLPALAVVTCARWAAARWGRRAAWMVGVGATALVLVAGGLAARDYFVTWGQSADVRAAYRHALVEAAAYLDAADAGGVVALSSHTPHAPHDPYVFQVSLRRADLSTRWFDASRALVLPAVESARLIAPASAPLDPLFDLPGLAVHERVPLRAGDLDPSFVVYAWDVQASRAALAARIQPAPGVGALGGALRLLGYDLRVAGGAVELLTLWEVLDPAPVRPADLSNAEQDLVLFAHAVDAAGAIVGQEDRLDAPAWDWEAGDWVAQVHRFTLASELTEGPLTVWVGAYRRTDWVRLPVVVEGGVVGDHIVLQAVEVP
ncbi:MAG: glycosyltransferase family 39 protein [Anaerolineae bacterium]|nr:glycosyltransferase family 39 protein [Anaerolineae bacterium]